ncbi:unnamed protein product [Cyprideis torosa]|uniref:Uncharacterized protein n=1 Tax=Cyprideis torosa TaxID=163714 RepID=A0A7R8WDA6_9CRUS|nr:unnamed protein product [Cyprideis torosa]CAG0888190.1 unnamed protein product [Cyprideis torosa]
MTAKERPLWYQYCVEFFTSEIEALRVEFGPQCAEKALKTLLVALDRTENALLKSELTKEPLRGNEFKEEEESGAEEESEIKPFQLLTLELNQEETSPPFRDSENKEELEVDSEANEAAEESTTNEVVQLRPLELKDKGSSGLTDVSKHSLLNRMRSKKKLLESGGLVAERTAGNELKMAGEEKIPESAAEKRRYVCKDCEAEFGAKSSLYRHQLLNHRKSERCRACYLLVPAENLPKHMEKHEMESNLPCVECGEKFCTKVALERHIIRHHRPENWIPCDVCGKSVFKYLIDKHKMIHKSSEGEQYPCTQCNKVYNTEVRLYNHIAGIHKPVGLMCPVCGKSFRFKCQLREHEALHSNSKLYSCDLCGREFAQRKTLNNHKLRDHEKLRPHKCKTCGKGFFELKCLNIHMTSHTGDRPFSCTECGLSYTTRASLYTHARIKHKFFVQ